MCSHEKARRIHAAAVSLAIGQIDAKFDHIECSVDIFKIHIPTKSVAILAQVEGSLKFIVFLWPAMFVTSAGGMMGR